MGAALYPGTYPAVASHYDLSPAGLHQGLNGIEPHGPVTVLARAEGIPRPC